MKIDKPILIISLIGCIVFLIYLDTHFELREAQDNLEELQQTYSSLKKDYTYSLASNYELKQQQNKTLTELAEANEVIQTINSRSAIEYQPSYNTVAKILRNDKTDKNKYHLEDFNCVEFSNLLVKGFKDNQVFACTTYILFDDSAHSIVAVNTKEFGIIYIEPQTDKIMLSLEVGDDYCKQVGWNCSWKIKKIKSCLSEF
jgi:hypothetical protein